MSFPLFSSSPRMLEENIQVHSARQTSKAFVTVILLVSFTPLFKSAEVIGLLHKDTGFDSDTSLAKRVTIRGQLVTLVSA